VEGRTRKIDELLATLEKSGGDERRLDALRRARQFKRSWVDLAQSLVKIRGKKAFQQWGYDDFHDYCSKELQLRRATVDKLTISYSTMQRHAPQVLQWDGLAKAIPSYQAIDYFNRALDKQVPGSKRQVGRAKEEAVQELKSAVFDEGQTIAELRKRFDPVLFPKTKAIKRLEAARQASRLAHRLAQVLPDIDDLSEKRRRQVESLLGTLRQELDAIAQLLQQRALQQRVPQQRAPQQRAPQQRASQQRASKPVRDKAPRKRERAASSAK
jgi:hypothetical protein